MQSTTIIAFDQHAATTVAAVLLPGQRTPALHPLTSDMPTILRFVERLRRQGPVPCCYEAGPVRLRVAARPAARTASPCDVIAPALIPRRAGRSHQDGSARCRAARRAVSRRRADRDSHSDRAGRSRPRSAALSRRHPRRSAPRAASPLEVPAAPRPAFHRRRRRPGRSATTRGCARRRGRCRRSSRRIAPICGPSTKSSRGCGRSSTDLRALLDARAAAAARATAALLPRHR